MWIAASVVLLASCGGGGRDAGPAGPGGPPAVTPPPVTPPPATLQPLSVASPNARVLQIVNVGVRGVTITTPTVNGRLGAQLLAGARVDDTTLAVVIPQVAVGDHELRFELGGTTFTTRLTVAALPAVANPDAFLDSLIKRVEGEARRMEQSLNAPSRAAAQGDTAGLRRAVAQMRAGATSMRQQLAALSPADRAQAASYLSANLAAFPGLSSSMTSFSSDLTSFASGPCEDGKLKACIGEIDTEWQQIATIIRGCAAKAAALAIISGSVAAAIAGYLSFGTAALPALTIGATFGGAMGATYCITEINERAMSNIIKPAIALLASPFTSDDPAVLSRLATAPDVYKVGVSRRVVAQMTLRPIVSADASESAELAAIVRLIGSVQRAWSDLARTAGITIAPPTTPSATQPGGLRIIPAEYLRVVSVSLPPATASGAGLDTMWRVTFSNPNQGRDHDVSFVIGFTQPGLKEQTRPLAGLLQPAKYVVATLTVVGVARPISTTETATLNWTALDSSGIVIDSVKLAGRRPVWSTSNARIATVSGTGVAVGVDTGTATITATLEGKQATASIRVVESLVGTYSAFEVNGMAVPYDLPDSTGTTKVIGGSLTLRADSTFSYSYSETYTNKFTGIVYDEGAAGGGRYVPNGSSAVFSSVNRTKGVLEPIGTASLANGVLSVSYKGGGGARMRK